MSRSLTSRLAAVAITVFSTVAMLGVSFEAEAARGRLGGGSSMGRQSTNITQQRQAVQPPAAAPRTQQGTAPAASAARAGATGAAAAGARSGASRWFGPIAGIAAGLGLAALLSSMGLGAAAAEFMASLLLIALLVFAVIFVVRRLRGGGRQAALQGAGNQHASPMQRQSHVPQPQPATLSRRAAPAAAAASAHPAVVNTAASSVQDESWHIPAGFDTQQFLQHAKQHFIDLQDAWDKNDLVRMHEFMTDELLDAVKASVAAREPGGKTDVVLLNAQLLGVEKVAEGNMASVRFSGMLRDDSGPEAYRFEEVWNFLKPVQGGWVLAGIQQIPVQYES